MLQPIAIQFATKNTDTPSTPVEIIIKLIVYFISSPLARWLLQVPSVSNSSKYALSLFSKEFVFGDSVSKSRNRCANTAKDDMEMVQLHAYNEYQQYFLPSVTRKKTLRARNVFQMK